MKYSVTGELLKSGQRIFGMRDLNWSRGNRGGNGIVSLKYII